MNVLRRVVSGTAGAGNGSSSSGVRSARHRPSASSSATAHNRHKHEKLDENWATPEDDPVQDGLVFFLKYLGNVIVDHPNGEGTTAAAVKKIVAMSNAKSGGGVGVGGRGVGAGAGNKLGHIIGGGKRHLLKMEVFVSPRGIRMTEVTESSRTLFEEISIYRVSFCTNDSTHSKVFAFIARNNDNETMECHAFLCPKKKTAQAITLSVSHSFNLAFENWEREKEAKKLAASSATVAAVSGVGASSVSVPASAIALSSHSVKTQVSSPPSSSSPSSVPPSSSSASSTNVSSVTTPRPILLSAPPSKKQSTSSLTSPVVSPSFSANNVNNNVSPTATFGTSPAPIMTPFGPAPAFPYSAGVASSSAPSPHVNNDPNNPFLPSSGFGVVSAAIAEDDDIDLEFESLAASRNVKS